MRDDAHPALGHIAPRLGLFPVRRHQGSFQGSFSHIGRQPGTAQGAQGGQWIVRNTGSVAIAIAQDHGRGIHYAPYRTT